VRRENAVYFESKELQHWKQGLSRNWKDASRRKEVPDQHSTGRDRLKAEREIREEKIILQLFIFNQKSFSISACFFGKSIERLR
jgi:hypothetical protein